MKISVVLYTQCLRYNICSAWFLDIRISTCFPTGVLNTLNMLTMVGLVGCRACSPQKVDARRPKLVASQPLK